MIDVGTTRTIVNRFSSCCKEENSFEICCSFNEKINNGEFVIPDAPAKLTKNALKGLDKDNNRLDCESIVSAAATNKTVGDCARSSIWVRVYWQLVKAKKMFMVELNLLL